ncbi:hypothetical protein L596_000721 [Steinernema carpocapsae]|uniref:Zinc finger PHD-type domain-containing protein n=1 Tax=Steinernema carpocapsae TaxID=34508 RepID=A0A4U8UJR2_STECR|nr:hypothetical protein L596_000721 [Steinernema carpocapsae]
MRMKRGRGEEPKIVEPKSVCYCDGERRVGEIELHCAGCRKWYHQACLKDLKAFYGLPFMVCYQFYCRPCSNHKKEMWTVKQANFSQMLVMVLSNLTHNWRKAQASDAEFATKFFSLEQDIIPFIEREWDNLTSMPKRKKDSWHQTTQNALEKHPDIFVQRNGNEPHFKLKEGDLRKIGPFLDSVRFINRRAPTSSQNDKAEEGSTEEAEGPKTRGATKRKNAESSTGVSKKQKVTNDYVPVYIPGQDYIDFPFNRDGYRYFFVEPDNNCPYSEEELTGLCAAGAIPSVSYRIYNFPSVTLAPNDRAHQGVETHGDVAKVAADLSPGDTATASSLNTPRRQAGRLSLGDTICMAKAVAKLFEMIRKVWRQPCLTRIEAETLR